MCSWSADECFADQRYYTHDAFFATGLSLRDASSLPWPVVRGAWAMSMHEVEDGHLGWNDATQWSLNHLSASQISMVNQQTVPQKKVTIMKFHAVMIVIMVSFVTTVLSVLNMVVMFLIQRSSVLPRIKVKTR